MPTHHNYTLSTESVKQAFQSVGVFGRRAFLHDDLDDVALDASLIKTPPLELWPKIVRRVELPDDVETLLVQPIETGDAIRRIVDTPHRWRVLDDDVRRCLTRVFPYGILYTIEPEFILIVAVMHGSREPGYWKQRLATP